MTLIFTADDYGAYEEIDDGVISAVQNGWLNSVAMLANGHNMDLSVSKILPLQQAKRVDLGCHFTMNSGPALSKEMQSNHHFTHKGHFRPFFNMNIGSILKKEFLAQNMYDLKAELRAQIDTLRKLGVDVKHLSSHFNVLHFYPDFLKVQFEVLSEDDYSNIKIRSTNVQPEFSRYLLPLLARVTTINPTEITAKGTYQRISYKKRWSQHMKAVADWVVHYQKEHPSPAMPDVLDGFHYQSIGSLGISHSTKDRKAKRKGRKILKKVFEETGEEGSSEFLFHLADPIFMANEAPLMSKDDFKDYLNNKYYGVTPKYMDNRHIEYKSVAHFNEISTFELDPQPWSKI